MQHGAFGNREGILAAHLRLHGAMSGYDLMKRLQESPAKLMSANESSVYPVLKSLSGKGYIAGERAPYAFTEQIKTVWALTLAGRAALADWVCRTMTPLEYRQSHTVFEVKCCQSFYLDSGRRREFLEAQLAVLREYRDGFANLPNELPQSGSPFMLAVFSADIKIITADIELLETLLAMPGCE